MITEIVSETNKPVWEELKTIHETLDKMETRMNGMEVRMDRLEAKTSEIQMTLEKEMLLLLVTRLENELRRIKQRIEEIA